MWKVLRVSLSLALLSIHVSGMPTWNDLCVAACEDSLWHIQFGTGVGFDDFWTGYCGDTLRFSSTFLCAKQRCSQREIESGLHYLQDYCDEAVVKGLTIPSYNEIVANFSDEDVKAIRRVNFDDIPADEIVNNTLQPTQELWDRAHQTWVSMLQVPERS
jgi:hypothetical protein